MTNRKGCTKTRNGEMGTRHGYREMENWEQSKELEMKLLIGLGLSKILLPFFIFSFPAPRFSNM